MSRITKVVLAVLILLGVIMLVDPIYTKRKAQAQLLADATMVSELK